MLKRDLLILGLVGFVTCGVLGLAGTLLILRREKQPSRAA
jgi:hypothetical protein